MPCSGTLTLSSGPATQTVSASTAISNVFYQLSTNCTDTTTVSATGLPPGVTMTWDKAVRPSTISLSGTPSAAASGTYNYSILAMFAPTSDTTASATVNGAITVTASFTLNISASSNNDYTFTNSKDRTGTFSGDDPNLTFNVGDRLSLIHI